MNMSVSRVAVPLDVAGEAGSCREGAVYWHGVNGGGDDSGVGGDGVHSTLFTGIYYSAGVPASVKSSVTTRNSWVLQ